MGKISGPLLDQIDLHIEVPAVAYQELRGKETGATAAEMRQRVLTARTLQMARGSINATIPAEKLRQFCAFDASSEKTLEMAVRRLALSARAHDRILKVSRTHSRPRRQRTDPGQTHRRGGAIPFARPGILEVRTALPSRPGGLASRDEPFEPGAVCPTGLCASKLLH
jgi:hypothetical protein